MHVEAALRAVEREVLELAFEVGLHLQELEPEHLRVDGDRMITSTSSLRLVNEFVCLDRLLGDAAAVPSVSPIPQPAASVPSDRRGRAMAAARQQRTSRHAELDGTSVTCVVLLTSGDGETCW